MAFEAAGLSLWLTGSFAMRHHPFLRDLYPLGCPPGVTRVLRTPKQEGCHEFSSQRHRAELRTCPSLPCPQFPLLQSRKSRSHGSNVLRLKGTTESPGHTALQGAATHKGAGYNTNDFYPYLPCRLSYILFMP